MKKILIYLILAHFLQSCAPVTTTVSISSKDRLSTLRRDSDIKVTGPQVVTKPILANLDVGMERKKTIFNITISLGVGKENARKEAEQKAEFRFLEEHQCDFVMDPYFDTDISYSEGDAFYRISVVLTGLSVTYKKFTELDSLPKIFTQLNNLPSRTLPLIASISSNQKSVTERYRDWGFIAGVGLGWFSGNQNLLVYPTGTSNFTYYNKASAFLGFYRMYPINNTVSVKSELAFFSRNFSIERAVSGNTFQSTATYNYSSLGFDVPVLLDLKLNEQFSVHFGPSANLLFDESISVSPNIPSDILNEVDGIQARLALNAGFNVNFPRYYIGTRFFKQSLGLEQDRLMSGLGVHIGFKL
jgi:hypothetical protein